MSRQTTYGDPIVAIPVRNEAERLPKLLGALAKQTWIANAGRPLRVFLVLNNCADQSASIAAQFDCITNKLCLDLIEIKFAEPDAHVGSARRIAMDKAFAAGGGEAVLLTTDADAVPRDNWVEANLRSIGTQADLVGGLIVGDPDEEALLGAGFNRRASQQLRYNRLVDHLTALIDPIACDPWPRHTDHTGASLAVTSDAYAKLDGMPVLPCREDITFVEKARHAGFRVRHPLDVLVQVSARLEGRAKGGMADCIQGWVVAEQLGEPHLVEDPALLLHRLKQRSHDPIRLPWDRDSTFLNSGGMDMRGPEVGVETAIARLEKMMGMKGMR
jgi:hypothetical protein